MSTPIKEQIDRLIGVRSDINDAFHFIGVDAPEDMVFADAPDLIMSITRIISEDGRFLVTEDGDFINRQRF